MANSVSTGLKYARCRAGGCLVQISGQIIREFSSLRFTVANKFEATVGKVHACSVVSDSAASCSVAYQALPSMYFHGKNTEVGCHFFLQGIFSIQGSNPRLVSADDSLPLVLPGKPSRQSSYP